MSAPGYNTAASEATYSSANNNNNGGTTYKDTNNTGTAGTGSDELHRFVTDDQPRTTKMAQAGAQGGVTKGGLIVSIPPDHRTTPGSRRRKITLEPLELIMCRRSNLSRRTSETDRPRLWRAADLVGCSRLMHRTSERRRSSTGSTAR